MTSQAGYVYLVAPAIVIFYVHDEGVFISYIQSHVNDSTFSNLLEIEIVEMIINQWHDDKIVAVNVNQKWAESKHT